MIVQPIDYALVAWFAVAVVSTAYVAWDQFRNNPEPTVMRVTFILVTLYMGPLGLLLYVLADSDRASAATSSGRHADRASGLSTATSRTT